MFIREFCIAAKLWQQRVCRGGLIVIMYSLQTECDSGILFRLKMDDP